MRRHLDVRPFECSDCGNKYISKWNMLKHQKKNCKVAKRAQYAGTLLSKRNFSEAEGFEETEKFIKNKIDSWLEMEKELKDDIGKNDELYKYQR